ncbi:unnamed protein product [Acanthoscelides obtectus]|uniref:Uncharacterized protein n=1 Tax=Acanthoscelides obtectus TaxID=200917 RepID=A0A9P0KL44_ACAOB|nr:unnamed protein product [Acanthoscelides obtectus]CAK1626172.1 hypothetical protein AOBTE_LOCUS3661 [Acanthoscelides obtectus]
MVYLPAVDLFLNPALIGQIHDAYKHVLTYLPTGLSTACEMRLVVIIAFPRATVLGFETLWDNTLTPLRDWLLMTNGGLLSTVFTVVIWLFARSKGTALDASFSSSLLFIFAPEFLLIIQKSIWVFRRKMMTLGKTTVQDQHTEQKL